MPPVRVTAPTNSGEEKRGERPCCARRQACTRDHCKAIIARSLLCERSLHAEPSQVPRQGCCAVRERGSVGPRVPARGAGCISEVRKSSAAPISSGRAGFACFLIVAWKQVSIGPDSAVKLQEREKLAADGLMR